MLKNNEQAYVRGQKAAIIFKHLKRVVLTWDQRCMAWVKHHKLPTWLGHMPVVIAVLGSLAGILLGGVVIAGCLIFIWAIAFILQQIGQSTRVHITNWDKHPKSSHERFSRENNKDKSTNNGMFEPYDPEPYTYDEYDNRH
ncbi:MAG: hypothetical protein QRY16_14370 [Enterobacterales bacterium endosymbiont of Blomia tropicalis]|uniref:hypothetical protein n=1 Tax=Mixta mediterraneensis TaxID=2758443 RepID=UPI0025A7F2D8|nr:hypothetical protein [Mixta mediterraneensis]MDL4914925.1 hypothetical protein [Mixta mediterraneensis]